jgi:uncharacterized protein (TIGR03382 family)
MRLPLTLAALLLVPSLAHAHAVLLDPPPRDPNQIKTFPCGGAGPTAAASAQRTSYAAGSTITVEFSEFVQHPGYFRIAFSPNGLDGFDQHVLVPMIADTNGSHYSVQVTLPNTPCDSCSLQLIQCMDGSLPPVASCSNYYSCADLVLTGAAGTPDAGPPPPPGTPDADVENPPPPGSPDAAPGQTGGTPGGDEGSVSGACTVVPGGATSSSLPVALAWLLLPLFVALLRRRLARPAKS